MATTVESITGQIQWLLSKPNNGFAATKQGADQVDIDIDYDVSVIGKMIAKSYTLAASATQLVNLYTGNTDLLGDAVVMTKAAAFMVRPIGSNIKVFGTGTNGLTSWFIQNSGELAIKDGGFALIGWPASSAATVDATHTTISVTNTGSTSVVVTVIVFGG